MMKEEKKTLPYYYYINILRVFLILHAIIIDYIILFYLFKTIIMKVINAHYLVL